MRKPILFFTLALTALVITTSCKEGAGNEPSLENSRPEGLRSTYTCPMHPEVDSKYSGRCPKCGMDLVEKRTGSEQLHEKDIRSEDETPEETGNNVSPKTESTDSTVSKPQKSNEE